MEFNEKKGQEQVVARFLPAQHLFTGSQPFYLSIFPTVVPPQTTLIPLTAHLWFLP